MRGFSRCMTVLFGMLVVAVAPLAAYAADGQTSSAAESHTGTEPTVK